MSGVVECIEYKKARVFTLEFFVREVLSITSTSSLAVFVAVFFAHWL